MFYIYHAPGRGYDNSLTTVQVINHIFLPNPSILNFSPAAMNGNRLYYWVKVASREETWTHMSIPGVGKVNISVHAKFPGNLHINSVFYTLLAKVPRGFGWVPYVGSKEKLRSHAKFQRLSFLLVVVYQTHTEDGYVSCLMYYK